MKCPVCGTAERIHDLREVFDVCQGESTTIAAVIFGGGVNVFSGDKNRPPYKVATLRPSASQEISRPAMTTRGKLSSASGSPMSGWLRKLVRRV